jgi:hypothetical protein
MSLEPRPFPALSLDTLVQIASMTASMEDMHRLACVSQIFREAVEAVCSSRAADMGIRTRPPGFSWWAAVRESVMDTTGRDELLGESFFEDLHDKLDERQATAGTAGTIGIFEAKFCETFLVFERETYPTNVTVKSHNFYDRGMSFGGPPVPSTTRSQIATPARRTPC